MTNNWQNYLFDRKGYLKYASCYGEELQHNSSFIRNSPTDWGRGYFVPKSRCSELERRKAQASYPRILCVVKSHTLVKVFSGENRLCRSRQNIEDLDWRVDNHSMLQHSKEERNGFTPGLFRITIR